MTCTTAGERSTLPPNDVKATPRDTQKRSKYIQSVRGYTSDKSPRAEPGTERESSCLWFVFRHRGESEDRPLRKVPERRAYASWWMREKRERRDSGMTEEEGREVGEGERQRRPHSTDSCDRADYGAKAKERTGRIYAG